MSPRAVRSTCIALLLLAGLPAGCSSSSVVSEWREESFTGQPFRKVLVIALGKQQDLRRSYEDAFVRNLRERGGDAVAGYSLLPFETDKIDRAALSKAVIDSGADAVIVTRLLKTEERVVGSTPTYIPPTTGLYGYHSTAWSSYYEPGGSTGTGLQPYIQTIATLETSLFDAKTAQLVWHATTETFDADQAQRQIPGLVKTLTGAMVRAKVIA